MRAKFVILSGLLILASLAFAPKAHAFAGGDGSVKNPYIITTAAELDAVRNNLGAHYKLGKDIDLTEYLLPGNPGYHAGAGWKPIGSWDPAFSGVFDGGGYMISGLWSDRSGEHFIGLFARIHEGTVESLTVETAGTGMKGNEQVGVLTGNIGSGTIRNCAAHGKVTGRIMAGGLVGYAGGSEYTIAYIEQSHATADVSTTDYAAGGLIGLWASSGTVEKCYATGSVFSGGGTVGGFVGTASSGLIRNCYALGSAATDTRNAAGGFAGTLGAYGKITVENCYAVGSVSGEDASRVHGFVGTVGSFGADIANCFFDVETTGQTVGGSPGATGKSTEEMKTKTTFTDAGWDFEWIWGIGAHRNEGYPYFLAFRTGQIPRTGDSGKVLLWLILSAVFLTLFFALGRKRRTQ
ncbi:MAG: hypothetical protein FWE69_06500 [Clostridiales bacterium]|nr:hypothetical protein [Clostridiales bacterium]